MKPVFMTVIVAVYLAVCIKRGYAGSASRNSIKNLQNEAVSAAEPVSASPHAVSWDQGPGTRSAPLSCAGASECRLSELCSRGICQPCRKRRKRCARDSMCCSGNRCINGVCQAVEVNTTQAESTTDGSQKVGKADGIAVSGARNPNSTVKLQQGKKTTVPVRTQDVLKGGEGEPCLRSSDCGKDLCCARHFWSRICKPVLTEGQVCTRHHRKDTHSLEIFQRCDCGQGLVCLAQREKAAGAESQHQLLLQNQQQPGKKNKNRASRNLHTCQPL